MIGVVARVATEAVATVEVVVAMEEATVVGGTEAIMVAATMEGPATGEVAAAVAGPVPGRGVGVGRIPTPPITTDALNATVVYVLVTVFA